MQVFSEYVRIPSPHCYVQDTSIFICNKLLFRKDNESIKDYKQWFEEAECTPFYCILMLK